MIFMILSFLGLITAYLLYKEVMSVRLYVDVKIGKVKNVIYLKGI